MRSTTFKLLALQLGLFLAYQLLLFSLLHFYPQMNFVLTELIALSAHAFVLLAFSVFYFRKKQNAKAVGMLILFFVVLLIGLGSCSDGGYNHTQKYDERRSNKARTDSMRKADSVRKVNGQSLLR